MQTKTRKMLAIGGLLDGRVIERSGLTNLPVTGTEQNYVPRKYILVDDYGEMASVWALVLDTIKDHELDAVAKPYIDTLKEMAEKCEI